MGARDTEQRNKTKTCSPPNDHSPCEMNIGIHALCPQVQLHCPEQGSLVQAEKTDCLNFPCSLPATQSPLLSASLTPSHPPGLSSNSTPSRKSSLTSSAGSLVPPRAPSAPSPPSPDHSGSSLCGNGSIYSTGKGAPGGRAEAVMVTMVAAALPAQGREQKLRGCGMNEWRNM